METLKDKERLTIKDIVNMTKTLTDEQRKIWYYAGWGLSLSNMTYDRKQSK